MNLAKLIEYLRDRLKMVVKVCLAILALLILVDAVFVSKEHAHSSWEHFPAFWSAFGFVGCAAIVILSKLYGHAGIMTREDYYDQAEEKSKEISKHE